MAKTKTTQDKLLSLSRQSILNNVQSELNTRQRTISNIIHNRTVSNLANLLNLIIFRPTSLLIGSSLALLSVIISYILIGNYDYNLANTEVLVAFIFGWVIGLLVDLFAALRKN